MHSPKGKKQSLWTGSKESNQVLMIKRDLPTVSRNWQPDRSLRDSPNLHIYLDFFLFGGGAEVGTGHHKPSFLATATEALC